MISKFGRSHFPVWPAEFKNCFELKSFPSIWPQECNKYVTNLVILEQTKSYWTLVFPFAFEKFTCADLYQIALKIMW